MPRPNVRIRNAPGLAARLAIVSCLMAAIIIGCGSRWRRSLTTEETEQLAGGRLVDAPIDDYINMVGKPERVFLCRHQDSSLGVQGWVLLPGREMDRWVLSTVESGFQERECLLLSEVRLKPESDRNWPVWAAALIAAGAGAYAITADTPGYQQLRAVEGAASPLGVTGQDEEQWQERKVEAEIGSEPRTGRPLFVTWMYARGDRVTAYNFPALDELGVIRSYALNRAAVSPAADSLLQSLVPDHTTGDDPGSR